MMFGNPKMALLDKEDVITEKQNNLHFVLVGTRFDRYTIFEIAGICRDIIDSDEFGQGHQIIIDASKSDGIDHRGLSVLVQVMLDVMLKNGYLGIIPSDSIRRTLRVTGLDKYFTIYQDREHARRENIQ